MAGKCLRVLAERSELVTLELLLPVLRYSALVDLSDMLDKTLKGWRGKVSRERGWNMPVR